jgi:CheY-like chemotaxis protein
MDFRTVLIVEDDADAREALAHLLHLHGYMAIQAANGKEALDQIEATVNAPSLILLDLDMPIMSGTELLEQLGARPDIGNLKVIIITGQDLRAISGATAVLQKPVEIPKLLDLMHRLLRRPEADGRQA